MIKAELVRENGFLRTCSICGHAGAGPKGSDIVCAAVSVLARTAADVLSKRKGVKFSGKFPRRGDFLLEILSVTAEETDFTAGVGDFLTEGLVSVAREYPDFCSVSIEEHRR
ncbi:MAG: ribosomal-processing cysteine protease Prp [Treponema sp.]|nr:ribosomal-processing cysteine protease Prp [Treponema sp.]